MAKLRAGILGQVSGKVSGVVGGTWKDKNYVREYVIPANPNTAAQQVQRGLFGRAVDFCKPIVGPIFNVYTDLFQPKMSGFNFFIKRNIGFFLVAPEYENVKLTEGKLFGATPTDLVCDSATELVEYNHSTALGSNGSSTDKMYAAAYNETSGRWGFSAAEHVRSDGGAPQSIPLVMAAGDVISVYLHATKYDGTSIAQISDSGYATAVAADV